MTRLQYINLTKCMVISFKRCPNNPSLPFVGVRMGIRWTPGSATVANDVLTYLPVTGDPDVIWVKSWPELLLRFLSKRVVGVIQLRFSERLRHPAVHLVNNYLLIFTYYFYANCSSIRYINRHKIQDILTAKHTVPCSSNATGPHESNSF